MVTCQVESTSSRNASNSSSARSISSTSSTRGLSRSARSTGRASRNRSSNSELLGLVDVDRRAAARRPRGPAGAGSGAGSPSRRAPGWRRCPRSTAAGPAAGPALSASASASAVLPVPGSPSSSSGRCSRIASQATVARPASAGSRWRAGRRRGPAATRGQPARERPAGSCAQHAPSHRRAGRPSRHLVGVEGPPVPGAALTLDDVRLAPGKVGVDQRPGARGAAEHHEGGLRDRPAVAGRVGVQHRVAGVADQGRQGWRRTPCARPGPPARGPATHPLPPSPRAGRAPRRCGGPGRRWRADRPRAAARARSPAAGAAAWRR